VIIRAYKEGDELRVPTQENDWHRDLLPGLAMMGTVLSVTHEGEIVVVMGMAKLWAGVAECWSLVHPSSAASAIALVRVVKTSLETTAAVQGLRRANAMASDAKQQRWMRLLGFEYEFTQREGGPLGEDLVGMVKWFRGMH
jgi:hypothetical protein